MAKKYSGSSHRGARAGKNASITRDHKKIDFSDLPEFSDEQLAVMKPLGRPLLGDAPRKLIAVRVDPLVLEKIRKEAKKKKTKYQSLINEILAKHVKKSEAA